VHPPGASASALGHVIGDRATLEAAARQPVTAEDQRGRCLGGSEKVPVGTVDKFQGQEAPIAIYSLATSSPEEAPRGMEFLYSKNRLNVAISRARCVSVVVGNPALFRVQCKTPRQMELANAFCRFWELAGGDR
jgi:AAA domain